ncbi:hypothetical protein BED44_17640 [Citrobacter freundii]|nr:hypothetical protein BED44_17640 [Citrobacter freundii]
MEAENATFTQEISGRNYVGPGAAIVTDCAQHQFGAISAAGDDVMLFSFNIDYVFVELPGCHFADEVRPI